MTTLITEFIARVEEYTSKATKGPWETILVEEGSGSVKACIREPDIPVSLAHVHSAEISDLDNFEFIASARTDIEKLVKLVRVQDQIIKQHLATMETINERMGWQFTQPLINTHEKLKKQCEEILNE